MRFFYIKKSIVYVLLLTLFIITDSCAKKEGYSLEVAINGLNGKEVYLTEGIDFFIGDTIATTKIVDGRFKFEDESFKQTRPFSLLIPQSDLRNYRLLLFLEEGITKVQLDTTKTILELDWSEILFYPKLVTEGKTTLAYQKYLEERYHLFKDDKKSLEAAQQMTVFIETYNARKAFNRKWLDSFTIVGDWYKSKLEDIRYDFVLNAKNPQVAKHILVNEGIGFSQSYPTKALKAALDSLKVRGVVKDSVFTNLEKTLVSMQKAEVGNNAPNFNLMTNKGQLSELANYTGKYVFLDFWAHWCKPCIKEFPHLKKIYKQYADNNFEIVAIHSDPNKEKWLSALEKHKLSWPQLFDPSKEEDGAGINYNVEFLPTTFLIDPQGIIIAKNLRGEALDEKLKEIFSK